MKRSVLGMVVFAILLPLQGMARITAKEARTLPLPVLAKKLLGDAGSIMISVDRPRFKGTLEPVTFYSRAFAVGTDFGLCAADWVTVSFDKNGNVESVSSQTHYGIAGDIYRVPGHWNYKEYGDICAAVKSTRNYFPAPDMLSALDIAWYVQAVAGRGPYAKQRFSYGCTGECWKGR